MAWGAAVWEPIACCSWQPGGMMPRLRVSDWEAEVVFFISHFYIPQTLQLLRGGVLPCKIINPRLFSHVFIQQALEGCSWVSFSSWVGSHGCFFHTHTPPLPRPPNILKRTHPTSQIPGNPYAVWPDLMLKRLTRFSKNIPLRTCAKGLRII